MQAVRSDAAQRDGGMARAALAFAHRPGVRERWVRQLCGLLAIASVSAAPAREPLVRCARLLAAHGRAIGLSCARVVDGRYPAVIARCDGAPGAPSVLTYGHYDVQPPGPGWRSDPFLPVVRNGAVVARGASDDKGQLFMHLAALEALASARGRVPLNVRLWCEGEEEIGSPGAARFIERHLPELRADAAVLSDTEMAAAGRPALTYGLRGNVSLDVVVYGPRRALHSGRHGGAVANPIEALARMIASLHDEQRRVAVYGFDTGAERVAPASAAGYTARERATVLPAIVVTTLRGGDGASSIPVSARARVTARLVPGQAPAAAAAAIRAHLATRTPRGTRSVITLRAASPAVRLPRDAPAMRIAARALHATFGVAPAFVRSGGSIPIVEQLHRRLRAPVVVMGFGLPDDAIHGPNERFALDRFFSGIDALVRFYAAFAR